MSPVLAGTGVAAYADGAVVWKALLALVVSLALQVAVNYANDYSDGIRGTDAERVGPMRLVGVGRRRAGRGKRAAFLAFGVAAVAGLVLGGDHRLVAGRGRRRLRRGGVVLHRRLAGPTATSAWARSWCSCSSDWSRWSARRTSRPESWEWPALFAAVGVGALACAILVVNNLRDIPGDTVAGKRTLAVKLGAERTRALYALLVLAAAAAVVAVAVSTTWWALLGLGFLAPAVPAVRIVTGGATGPDLVPVLQQTGLAQLVWAALVSAALALAT